MYSEYLKREIDPLCYNEYVNYESFEGIVFEEWALSKIGFGFELPEYESDLEEYKEFTAECKERLKTIEYRLSFEHNWGISGYYTYTYGPK